MRTLFLLWRMYRLLAAGKGELRAASINIVVERESTSSYLAACTEASLLGEPKPPRRTAWEVSIWKDANEALHGTSTKRGHTLAEALAPALRG